jgi:hypothetical protein
LLALRPYVAGGPKEHLVMKRRWWIGLIFVPLSLVAGAGCSRGKPVRVHGSVTLDDKPLAGATVVFQPVENTGRSAGGLTDTLGNFDLTTFRTGDGALPGEYRVTVDLPNTKPVEEFFKVDPTASQEERMKQKMMHRSPQDRKALQAAIRKAPPSPVPAAYRSASSTPLREIVPPEGDVSIQLKSGLGSR